jgi:hypothetical protein
MDEQNRQATSDVAIARRDFLRKSVYAACATPVIMSLFVERAGAAQSWNPGFGRRPPDHAQGPEGGASNSGRGPQSDRWDPAGPGRR